MLTLKFRIKYFFSFINLNALNVWTICLNLSDNDTDRSIWFHYLTIIIPDDLQNPDYAALYITAGSNNDR